MNGQRMKINYDKKYDTLCVNFSDTSNSYGDDSDSNIVLLRDMNTDEITGFTIYKFLKKYTTKHLPNILENFELSIKDEILPYI